MALILKKLISGAYSQSRNICKINQIQRFHVNLLSTKVSPEVKVSEELQGVILSFVDAKPVNPLAVEDYFQVGRLFTVSDLFDARVHYGHKVGSLNDYMRPYLFGERLGHLIFDLDITARLLKQALNFTAHVAYRDGIILFVSQVPQHSLLIENAANECEQFAHTKRWRLGMFTNSTMMFGAMTRLPDMCIVVNTLTTVLDQHPIVAESAKMSIPVVGIVDTNCDPRLITYPVPGNDDSPVSIDLYCRLFKTVIMNARELRKKNFQEQ